MKLGSWLCVFAAFSVVTCLLVEGLTGREAPGRGPRGHDPVFLVDREMSANRPPPSGIVVEGAYTTCAVYGCDPATCSLRRSVYPPVAHPRALWGIDDNGLICPLAPELVRRGRIIAMPWGWRP